MENTNKRYILVAEIKIFKFCLFKDSMSTTLRSVLISDPVDACCGELLVRHGIPVTTKYKLSKEKLIKELQVCINLTLI